MKVFDYRWVSRFAAVCLILLLPGYGLGAEPPPGSDYLGPLQQMLIADGFDSDEIESLFKNPKVYFDIVNISRFFSHREAQLNYGQFTSFNSIRKARRYMQTYEADLESAEKKFGVEREVITAIILVETQFGTVTGSRSVVNSLSSLASLSDPDVREQIWNEISNPLDLTKEEFMAWSVRRSKWAYAELKAFLKYAGRETIDVADINGSIAGALGIAQFMPSSILAFARDGDGDGRVDLFNHADAIASIANYLKHYGWRPGIDSKKAYEVIFHYNRSSYYVNTVLDIVKRLKG